MIKLRELLEILSFVPISGQVGIWKKTYGNCSITVQEDLENPKSSTIDWDDKILVKRSTTSNFSQEETLVILECVDRLLTKGYKPEDIILEDSWRLGHKGKGFLDISVKKNGQTFLMIECKTPGKEYEKELRNLHKDGGQLFSYFQQDKSAQYLVLYTSKFENGKVNYKNDIVVIEQSYRETNNLKDLFDRWNKITNSNGIFEEWVSAYKFEKRSLTKKDLESLTEADSSLIFHEFASILRRHAVSDKPNAFNKIFNLFLAKIFDEKKRETDELEFQWREGHPDEDEVEFEVRLINLYKGGMNEFLKKEVDGIDDEMFSATDSAKLKESKRKVLRLDSIFKIKEVHDEETFMDNFRVLKDVVLLLQKYQIRYPRKQRHLSDFFELLLTTGLKQEAGQFFTPPAVAKFMVRSLPFEQKIQEKLKIGNTRDLLPNIIDYACGSGHFLTESMEETQQIIDNLDIDRLNLYPQVEEEVEVWQKKKYDWAKYHVYGIEKDSRLVKVAKVGCYFYGDGLAQVVHGDGLDSFADSKSYRGLLKQDANYKNPNHPKFDFILANPPYSVDNFKLDLKNKNQDDFELYNYLTDNSSEIETLFIERTKQLLASGGVAAIILPSSILSNTGLYTKTRGLLLKHFEFIAIAEFGNNTFMATGTNTVILFLKKRENGEKLATQIKTHIQKAFDTKQDLTINDTEKLVSKYLKNTEQKLSLEEYLEKFQDDDLEKQKLLYFALAYPQKIALINSGQKDEEKKFLGYYFSNRRGHEGIKPFVAGGSVDDCTYLYDENDLFNPKKASTYIQKAFAGELENTEVDEELEKHISKVDLVDLLDFESKKFEKIINTRAKKKLKYDEIWGTEDLVYLSDIAEIKKGESITSKNLVSGDIPVVAGGKSPAYYHNQSNREKNIITISASGANSGFVNYYNQPIFASDCNTVKSKDEKLYPTIIIYNYLICIQNGIYETLQRGQAQPHVYANDIAEIKLPDLSPDKIIKITTEIEKLEKEGENTKKEIKKLKNEISEMVENAGGEEVRLGEAADSQYGWTDKAQAVGEIRYLRITDIDENSRIKLTDKKFISPSEKIKNQYLLKNNDIVIARSGSIGKATIYKNGFEPMIFASYLIRLKLDENKVLPDFIFQFTQSKKYWDQVYEKQTVGNQPNLNAEKIKEFKLSLPSLQTQQKIVARIQKIEEKINVLQTTLATLPTKKETILKRYL